MKTLRCFGKYSVSALGIQHKSYRSTSPPKLIVHDNSLIRAFERPIAQTQKPERMAFYLENAVGARFIESGGDTFYWKEKNYEVDFVVLGPQGEKWAIEVKTSAPSIAELKRLAYFCRQHPDFEACIVSPQLTELAGFRWLPADKVLAMDRWTPYPA